MNCWLIDCLSRERIFQLLFGKLIEDSGVFIKLKQKEKFANLLLLLAVLFLLRKNLHLHKCVYLSCCDTQLTNLFLLFFVD